MARLSILIAEKSYLIRKGLVSILLEFPSIGQVTESDDEESFLENLEKESYQICFINPSMLGTKGEKIIKDNGQKKGQLMIAIVPSELTETEQLVAFADFIFLDAKKSQLVNKLDELFTQILNKQPISENTTGLSDREKNILRHIALGHTNKEIGEKLFISTHTVVTHRKNITRKLGIKTVSGLTVYAIFNKIVGMDEIRIS